MDSGGRGERGIRVLVLGMLVAGQRTCRYAGSQEALLIRRACHGRKEGGLMQGRQDRGLDESRRINTVVFFFLDLDLIITLLVPSNHTCTSSLQLQQLLLATIYWPTSTTSRMSSIILQGISILRMATGLACMVVPRQTTPLFGVSMLAETSVLARLFGSRELVVGAYLWKTVSDWQDAGKVAAAAAGGSERTPLVGNATGHGDGSRKAGGDVRVPGQAEAWVSVETAAKPTVAAAIWLGMVCDAIDVVSVAACAWEGNVDTFAILNIGGAGATFALLAAWQLFSLAGKDKAEEK